jgi:WD domain, G-beta repeat
VSKKGCASRSKLNIMHLNRTRTSIYHRVPGDGKDQPSFLLSMTNYPLVSLSWYVPLSSSYPFAQPTFVQTLDSHTTPLTALDFSEPYGILVSASEEDAQPRVWDLLTGSEIGRLRGHVGAVNCLQVEDHVCLTGGEDGNIRLWDLRRVDEDDGWGIGETDRLPDVAEEEEGGEGGPSGSIRSGEESEVEAPKEGACARVLEGHSRAVTALYFEDECLVSDSLMAFVSTILTAFLSGNGCFR